MRTGAAVLPRPGLSSDCDNTDGPVEQQLGWLAAPQRNVCSVFSRWSGGGGGGGTGGPRAAGGHKEAAAICKQHEQSAKQEVNSSGWTLRSSSP